MDDQPPSQLHLLLFKFFGLTSYTRLALFYSLIIHCISFVYSSLPRPLSKITVARDRYLTKDFNNGLGSEL